MLLLIHFETVANMRAALEYHAWLMIPCCTSAQRYSPVIPGRVVFGASTRNSDGILAGAGRRGLARGRGLSTSEISA